MGIDFRHIKKKLALLGMLALTSISLTGCGEELREFATTTLVNDLDTRFDINIQLLQNLYNAGLLTQNEFKTWQEHIEGVRSSTLVDREVTYKDENEDEVTGVKRCTDILIDKEDGTITGSSYKSLSRLKIYSENQLIADCGATGEDADFLRDNIAKQGGVNYLMLGNYLASEKALNEYNVDNVTTGATEISVNSVKVKPLHIIENNINFIDLDFNIKVLNPNIDYSKMDDLIQMLKSGEVDYTKLDTEYFQDAQDTSGNKVMLSDLIDLDVNKLIKNSVYVDNSSDDNTPGHDLAVYQEFGGTKHYVGSMRFYEFNKDEIDKITNFMGIDSTTNVNTDKWLIRKKQDTGKNTLYLMEYPVYYVTGFQDYTDQSGNIIKNKTEATIEQSELSVNIKTGNILYTKNGASSVITSTGDPYLTFGSSVNSTGAEGDSSFFMCGVTNVDLANGLDDVDSTEVTTGRLILRDYLEVTYAPNFDELDDTGLVVLGRKLRLVNMQRETASDFDGSDSISKRDSDYSKLNEAIELKNGSDNNGKSRDNAEPQSSGGGNVNLHNKQPLSWLTNIPLASGSKQTKLVFDKDRAIAQFVNHDGIIVDELNSVMITDLSSIDTLLEEEVLLKPVDSVSALDASSPQNKDETNTTRGLATATTQNWVDTTTQFPGPIVGKNDYEKDNSTMSSNANYEETQIHQQFYGMFVATDMFEKGLFSTWLNSPDEEASLSWWITYLADNNYVYALSTTAVENYLYKNYTYELQKSGIVMLDLEVVARIQEEMDLEKEASESRNIRTAFKILGWFLIVYGLVLFLSWMLDVNADTGLNLTNKLTLGNWYPIKDLTDTPYMDSENRKYVDLSKLTINCMVIVLVGILLIFIDVYSIVSLLIKLLGVLALQINKMLTGMM